MPEKLCLVLRQQAVALELEVRSVAWKMASPLAKGAKLEKDLGI